MSESAMDVQTIDANIIYEESNPADDSVGLHSPFPSSGNEQDLSFGAFRKSNTTISFPTPFACNDDYATDFGDESVQSNMRIKLKAVVTARESGVIIGKAGENVSHIRECYHVKAAISKPIFGTHDRVLVITGTLKDVVDAYKYVASILIDNQKTLSTHSELDSLLVFRFLVPQGSVGLLIGKNGKNIKEIQKNSNTKVVAAKELFFRDYERIVEVHGDSDGISAVVGEIGKAICEEHRLADKFGPHYTNAPNNNTSYYNQQQPSSFPYYESDAYSAPPPPGFQRQRAATIHSTMPQPDFTSPFGNPSTYTYSSYNQPALPARLRSYSLSAAATNTLYPASPPQHCKLETKELRIPEDMVGCIIGKGGTRITEIRRLSKSRIAINKAGEDDSGERLFTIVGTPENNERALILIYGQLEAENKRRIVNSQLAANIEAIKSNMDEEMDSA